MSRQSQKSKKTVGSSPAKKEVCPECGHDKFHKKESMWSWLLGQRFVCNKCGATFKQANLVTVDEKTSESRTEQTKPSQNPKKQQSRKQRTRKKK
ncbi:MAG: hypothetical protein JW712_04290 [Dehalococcoidales bacterium]|nr:hypothetical protein [Dehalococcoidales bacterium]